MSILDIPTEILEHILSYNMRAWTYGTCRELSDIENFLAPNRKKYVDGTYGCLDYMLDDGESMHFYLQYYPRHMTNYTDRMDIMCNICDIDDIEEYDHEDVRTLPMNNVITCMKGTNRRMMQVILSYYLPSLSVPDVTSSSMILPYHLLDRELKKRMISLGDWTTRILTFAIKGRNDDVIIELLKRNRSCLSNILGVVRSIGETDILYLVSNYPEFIGEVDHHNMLGHMETPSALSTLMSMIPSITMEDVLTACVVHDKNILPILREFNISDIDSISKLVHLYLDNDNIDGIRRMHKAGYSISVDILLDYMS